MSQERNEEVLLVDLEVEELEVVIAPGVLASD
jgi:hypothetical protein